jgi:hypothetical protein
LKGGEMEIQFDFYEFRKLQEKDPKAAETKKAELIEATSKKLLGEPKISSKIIQLRRKVD